MISRLIAVALLPLLFSSATTHSMLAWPQNMSPSVCRLGGNPNPGHCAGPCDVKAIAGGFSNFDKPTKPAAIFHRGQKIKVKYQRNNHGPGGIVRHTLVPIDKMMDKRAHARNAFSYSCFGARAVRAKRRERKEDRWGFSMVGNDGKGKKNRQATGYYVSEITIPPVVPDGYYVLGWVWYGGTGGPVSNKRNTPPGWKGYFSDYWSCSFVKVQGGKKLEQKYAPVFKNDMQQFSNEGCMSANDAPGVCTHEPCIVYGKYQKPKPFKKARGPDMLTPANFFGGSVTGRSGGEAPEDWVIPKAPRAPVTPRRSVKKDPKYMQKKYACRCIGEGHRCGKVTARKSMFCEKWVKPEEQSKRCQQSCCRLCRLGSEDTARLCINKKVKTVCNL